jgi:flagellar hook-associated protein FlgK
MGRTKKLYTFAEINQQLSKAKPPTDRLEDIIDSKDLEIMELKHQIIGYKAVVSYLEHQLGLGKTQ